MAAPAQVKPDRPDSYGGAARLLFTSLPSIGPATAKKWVGVMDRRGRRVCRCVTDLLLCKGTSTPPTFTAGCSTQASPVLTSWRRRRRTHSGWQDRALLWASAASSFTRYVHHLCFWPARLFKACATCQLPHPCAFIAPQIRHWRELTEPLTTEDRDAIKRVRGIALVSNLWGSLFSAQLTEVATLKQHYFTQDLERCVQAATGLDGWVLTLVGGARQGKVGGVSGL